MSQITVIFTDFEEMMNFARALLKGESDKAVQPVPSSAQTQPVSTAQPAPVSYGQQIAQHFPAANTSQVPVSQTAPVQTTAPSYKLDDLSNAAMQLMDKGMQAQLQQLLGQFGVEALPQLPADQYGNFATALRGLGAQI